jgi:hypothetical protein
MQEVTKHVTQILSALLILVGVSGCLPLQEELQVTLKEHNITKKIFIKNETEGYDAYKEDKKTLYTLARAAQYDVVDIKEGYARLAKSPNNNLESDVWVSLDALESEATYFLTLTTNTLNPKILVEDQTYQPNMRLPQGEYRVILTADGFLDKSVEIRVDADTHAQILLDLDTRAQEEQAAMQEAQMASLAIQEAQITQIAMEEAKKAQEAQEAQKDEEKKKRAKIAKEMKKNVYLDKAQKLMWQDNTAAAQIKKPWITAQNYEAKNYNDTSGDSATAYCKNLTLVGYSDWRLPTKEELKNLFNQKNSLKNVSSDWYWSSSTSQSDTERAWGVYFNNGDGYSDLKSTSNYVRCVRASKYLK